MELRHHSLQLLRFEPLRRDYLRATSLLIDGIPAPRAQWQQLPPQSSRRREVALPPLGSIRTMLDSYFRRCIKVTVVGACRHVNESKRVLSIQARQAVEEVIGNR